MAVRLSIILICKDEASRIRETLEAVRFADEVVVVDSGSTDGTPEIAAAIADRVVVTEDWPGFGPQKNRALDAATGDWVLSIDADELVSQSLRDEILSAIEAGTHDAWRVPRLTTFLGREIRHSGWWPDYVLRLFRRGAARFSNDLVHERVVFEGSVGTLRNHLQHSGEDDAASLREKSIRYATAAAASLHADGRSGGPCIAAAKAAAAFLKNYVVRRGFLDGRAGWVIAITAAAGKWRRYMRLAELNRGDA
ncbi:MAG: glycosyltransferase family 2 protein [Phycisphaerales bacterium]|jgi:glycosyltransferase involved in cell wall biosynthesis|nr:glycosyltransferase family 2 protein [Phycisphaerales bacterium]